MHDFDEVLLLSGMDFVTTNGITFYHPKIELMKKIGSVKYFNFTSLFTISPHEIMVELWDRGIDFEETTSYEIFLNNLKDSSDYFDSLWKYFSNIEFVFADGNNIKVKIKDSDDLRTMDEDIFNEISGFYKAIHMKGESKAPKFKNHSVKVLVIELEKEERDLKKSPSFAKILSSLVWAENGSYKYDEIWDLYTYQFYDGLRIVSDIKDNNFIMYGVYTGNVDTKSIDKDRLNWIRSK